MKDVYQTIRRARKIVGFVCPETRDMIHRCLNEIEQGDLLACFNLDDIMNEGECLFIEATLNKFDEQRGLPASFENNMNLLKSAANLFNL